jgi:hypothetical protein
MATNLAIYLNDHLAGSSTALELLDRLRGVEPSSWIDPLRRDISDDRATLTRFMEASGIAISELRKGAGWLGEKLLALKTRLDDPVGGALHRLELLEVLAIGIDGKQALWHAMDALPPAMSAHANVLDLPRLIVRAKQQRDVVEEHRLAAARHAFIER